MSSISDVRRAAEALLDRGFFDEMRDPNLTIGAPLPVVDEGGELHAWFVPLLAGVKIAGFVELSPSLEPRRASSFQRRHGSYDDCPDAADWTDPARILERARTLAATDETLSRPVLSFDQIPSRFAWRVEARNRAGERRILYVAGVAAYAATGARGLG